ncbi:MAG: hypothetical protein JXB03_10775 [Spirochaetales bacterium]|nr:hypothetical protein [Spirochaetales bacterium]
MKHFFLVILGIFALCACSAVPFETIGGDLVITVNPGEEWLHRFSFFKKNTPTFAVWLEDENGQYLDTLFATRKIATEGWIFNNGNKRIESLPVWSHLQNTDGQDLPTLPTKDRPLPDSITGATPKNETHIIVRPHNPGRPLYIFLEINHSTDFNQYWPENAQEGGPQWTGGSGGSGQPSLVYRALIDPSDEGPWILELVGHGSPDGSSGMIYPDVSSITSALYIIDSITVERK